MQITPESKTIKEIFSVESTRKYKIPDYQRNYSWTEDNVNELITDINREDQGYYMGNILVINNKDIYEVVDGQQRLTSLVLIFIAILNRLNELSEKDLDESQKEKFYSLKTDIKRKLLFEETRKVKLELLDDDAILINSILEKVINTKATTEIDTNSSTGPDGRRLMVKRYNYIIEWLREECINFNSLMKFYDKVNQLEILQIIVDDLVDAFSIFSSLNAKGLPLSLLDLLKVQYLEQATGTTYTHLQWRKFSKIFEDDDNEINIVKATQFLLNHYDTFFGEGSSSITKKSALKLYKNQFQTNGCSYIDKLIESAEVFSDIVDPEYKKTDINKYDENIQKLLIQLSRLDISSAYPLLLYYFTQYNIHHKIELEELTQVLLLLKKFYIRRNIVLKPKSSNIRGKILELIRKLNNIQNNSKERINEIKNTLKSISVNDSDFFNALIEPVYDGSSKTVRIMLIDLERNSPTPFFNKQRIDNLDDYTLTPKGKKIYCWTLEHILPEGRQLSTKWCKMISPDNPELAQKIQEEIVHKLGNLTLTAYNSELSNNDFLIKRELTDKDNPKVYVGLRSGINLNKSIPSSEETIEQKNSWTKSDINRRTNLLANEILELYKF